MKIKILAAVLTMATYLNATAQEGKPVVLLTNYSFAKGKNLVGDLKTIGNESVKVYKLSGADGAKFSLKGNQLSLKPAYNKASVKWYDVTVSAKAASGTITSAFRIVNDQFHRNRVVAHRGAWKNTPTTENSITSLKKAVEIGCQGSEFDVHMSSDSVMFIHHDPKVGDLTIEKTPAADLYKVKLTNGESLPTLEQYLKAGLEQNTTRLVLEIKPSLISKERAQALTVRVMNLVRSLKAQGWVDYISFDYDVCKKLLELDPYATVQYLNGDKSPEELKADKLTGLDYHFSVFDKHPDWIAKALAIGLTVNVWTVNDDKIMQSMFDQKVNFVTTNEPEKALEMVKAKK